MLFNDRIRYLFGLPTLSKMSTFPSIEEFDSGHVTATRLEEGKEDDMGLLDSAQNDFLAREQAILGHDAEFFQSTRPSEGEAAFFGGNQGTNLVGVGVV